ncbi:penicillin-binding protein 1C [Undibacterium sp.]|jgi:penicillin-binding protein 1C|uniref:penicillin-binding protein 1C n=1 Tax=Undibacterium sp. TaxID=1914977 RepID=UPI002C8E3FEF|nr:penicillin-binding protein 1C [Undibacterium sp.]HTD06695.1 penicillin-binding protein 1C [Undibacterium sp.]
MRSQLPGLKSLISKCDRYGKYLLAALCLSLPVAAAFAVPTFAEVQQEFRSSDAVLYDRNGAVLHQLRLNPKERKLSWVKLEDVSPALRNALIASEDKRFYQHAGVDWNAVAAAAWGNVWHTRTRGASTITMQLAGLLQDDLRRKAAPRSTTQKINQALVARALEQSWRKDQVLEAYLNLVAFRGELVGVHALSRVLFDKHPSGLDQTEAAIAVALIRAPNAKPEKVAERACNILKEQNLAAYCQNLAGITELRFARLSAKSGLLNVATGPQLAPHLARRLLKLNMPVAGKPDIRNVRSTLDAGTQSFARDALIRQLSALVDRNIEDGAIVVLDNASGDVLAWVGSSGSLSDASQVDGVTALRQAGSTLKPFLYELAIERKWLTAASILDDSAVNLPTASGLYIPQNYDKHFKGLVSVRTALGSSLNIPAVRTLVTVTPETFFQRLQNLGFQLRESGDYYGYSLALGSADVSLLALTNAYRSLANNGKYSAVRVSAADGPARETAVMDAASSFIVGDILADRAARAVTFGLENALATRFWAAVKTGTSKDMRDNWCIGYSDRYTVGVWVGNASGSPMWDVSGVTGAAPIWQEVMQYLNGRAASQTAARPRPGPPAAGVIALQIHYESNLEAPRSEYFLSGTQQSLIKLAGSNDIYPSIRYPTAGMLVALDPDIPPQRQRIRFSAQGISNGKWLLDGKPLRLAAKLAQGSAYDWMPWPGKHTLSLYGANGDLLDQVRFEVRGAMERPRQKKSGS